MPTRVIDLETPCLVLDAPLFRANLLAMRDAMARAGKRLRPHAKTHKCSRVARAQLEAGAVGVCAAKCSEAEGLVAAGVEPVLITGPVVEDGKLRRLADLALHGHRIALTLDSEEAARRLEAACAARGAAMDVLLDVDPSLGRTGIPADRAPGLADFIASSPHLRLVGMQMYAGKLQHVGDFRERRTRSLETMRQGAEVFRALKSRHPAMAVYTGGGTGTFDIDTEIPELTDVQAGSYAVMDAQYLAVGSRSDPAAFGHFRPALRVRTTVLSANAGGHVTVDAGLKTLYKDAPPPLVLSPGDGVYTYDWFGDEYGRVEVPAGARPLRVGDVLEVVPSHCDPTVNLFDRIHVVEGDFLADVWPVDLRGKSQ